MALARELDLELDHVELFQGWKGHLKTFFVLFLPRRSNTVLLKRAVTYSHCKLDTVNYK